jgi:hypothetical protein
VRAALVAGDARLERQPGVAEVVVGRRAPAEERELLLDFAEALVFDKSRRNKEESATDKHRWTLIISYYK